MSQIILYSMLIGFVIGILVRPSIERKIDEWIASEKENK